MLSYMEIKGIYVESNDLTRIKEEALDIVMYYVDKLPQGATLRLLYKDDYLEISFY